MNPAISVIVPAYNAARFIERTIRSVQAQTFSGWEMIIVNDGSTDETGKIIASFLSDERITVVNQVNSGVCVARNTGLSFAKGEFIALLDADDEFLPFNLEKKINALKTHTACSWVFSNLRLIDEHDQGAGPDTRGRGSNVLDNILLWDNETVPGPCSNIVFRKKLLEQGIKFDERFSTAADQDFCLQLAGCSENIFIEEPLACYRILSTSMSRNVAVMEKDHIGVYRKAEKNNLFHSAAFRRKCFSNLYLILAGSWWVNAKNKKRALLFMAKSITMWPPNFFKLVKKIF